MKIKAVMCQVEDTLGSVSQKFVDFDIFMVHMSQCMTESGGWKEPQTAKVRAKGNWEGLYLPE